MLQKLGDGATASVYRAFDTSGQGVSQAELSAKGSAARLGNSTQIRIWALLGMGVVLTAALAIYAIYPAKESSEYATPPITVTPLTSYPGNEVQPSFSPDGNQVAFAFNGGPPFHVPHLGKSDRFRRDSPIDLRAVG